MTKYNKGLVTLFTLGFMVVAPVISANAAQSARWVGTSETWRVSDNAGGYLKNTWFQDNETGDWYLMGAQDGTVMYAGLITDTTTGKTNLLNINHDGTYGRMVTANSERQVETGSEWVVDSPAWEETCQVCSVCGAKQ